MKTNHSRFFPGFIYLVVLVAFNGCKGQPVSSKKPSLDRSTQTALPADTVSQLSSGIMRIYQDKKGNYWFGSWEDGLYKFDGKVILHFTTKQGLPHNRVEEINEDQEGLLYFNTLGGLCKYDGKQFFKINAIPDNDWILQEGDLWFKALGMVGKVYRYDGKVLHLLTLPECPLGQDWLARNPQTTSPYDVYTIYKDQRKHIWFGTAVLGACRFNGKSMDWISEEDVHELHYNPSNGVRSILEDQEGYLWFNSAYKYKILEQNYVQVKFYLREKSIGPLDGIPGSDFWEYLSIAKDQNNTLWFVTYLNGVWHYDGTKTHHYPVQVNGKNIKLFYLYKDNQNVLWLGTHENGAYRFNGTAFEPFSL